MISQNTLIIGGVVVTMASLIGGISGFGTSLLCTPALLILGVRMGNIIVVNLALTVVTRTLVVIKLRHVIAWKSVGLLLLGSIPGAVGGRVVLGFVDAITLRRAVGVLIVVMGTVVACEGRLRVSAGRGNRRGEFIGAGTLGGLLGATTSLNGVPAVLAFSRQGLKAASFLGSLAAYFIGVNVITIASISGSTSVSSASGVMFLAWLPGAAAANFSGTIFGSRINAQKFRALVLGLVLVSGVVTVLTT